MTRDVELTTRDPTSLCDDLPSLYAAVIHLQTGRYPVGFSQPIADGGGPSQPNSRGPAVPFPSPPQKRLLPEREMSERICRKCRKPAAAQRIQGRPGLLSRPEGLVQGVQGEARTEAAEASQCLSRNMPACIGPSVIAGGCALTPAPSTVRGARALGFASSEMSARAVSSWILPPYVSAPSARQPQSRGRCPSELEPFSTPEG